MKMDHLKVIVFDLDYTLWPFWVDTHVRPPFKIKDGKVVDSNNEKIKFYPEVPEVLKYLKNEGYKIGVASRTSEIRGANQLLELFDWNKFITYKEIFPDCKVTHFNNIKKNSNCNFNEMLFFDDENRNINDISKLGVLSILVKNGVTKHVVENGIQKFIQKHNA